MMWEDAYDKIREAGLSAALVVKSGRILCIEVYSPAIQLDTRMNILKETCGSGFRYQPVPNEEIISITKQTTT